MLAVFQHAYFFLVFACSLLPHVYVTLFFLNVARKKFNNRSLCLSLILSLINGKQFM